MPHRRCGSHHHPAAGPGTNRLRIRPWRAVDFASPERFRREFMPSLRQLVLSFMSGPWRCERHDPAWPWRWQHHDPADALKRLTTYGKWNLTGALASRRGSSTGQRAYARCSVKAASGDMPGPFLFLFLAPLGQPKTARRGSSAPEAFASPAAPTTPLPRLLLDRTRRRTEHRSRSSWRPVMPGPTISRASRAETRSRDGRQGRDGHCW